MNIGQHEPVIEMNLGGDAMALAFPNPVHRVLEICGVSLATDRDVFIEVEGLNTIKAFGALSGDADVTQMAKRMASRTANAGRVFLGTSHADQAHPGLGLLGEGSREASDGY